MKMKILFNGFRHGHINGLYAKTMASENFQVAGCVEPNDAARTAAEEKLGAFFTEKTYDSWLSADIDIVAIGTAYGERGEAVIKALSAGKHVIADKPVCTDLKQLEIIESLCKEKNRKLICMLDLRYLPQTLMAKQLLDSGRLGQVRNVAFNGQHCIDYTNRPGWYFEEGMHGGTINDLAIHGVDLVRMLTGMEITQMDAARTWNGYAHKHPFFKDCALFMARLENGAGVMADVSYSAPAPMAFAMPSYWEFRVWCEKGMLTFNYKDAVVTLYEEGSSAPEVIACPDVECGYLQDLYHEIMTDSMACTENVIRSTRATLLLQQLADQEA